MIDTHAHLMLPEFARPEIPAIIERAKASGVSKIMNLGCSVKTSEDSLKMSADFEDLYASCGVHPYDALDVNEALMAEYADKIAKYKKIVAIGETGLDYHREGSLIEEQKKALRLHFDLARGTDMPVIIHSRDAALDCLQLLDEFKGVRGVMHCFSYDLDYAREIWKRGIFTSFTGIVTYPNAKNLLEVIKQAPKDMMMIETDSPYLPPQAKRGERNEPANVAYVEKLICDVRGGEKGVWQLQLEKNTEALFTRLSL